MEEGTNKPLTSECAKGGERECSQGGLPERGAQVRPGWWKLGGGWPHVGANRTVVARTQASGLRDKTLGFMLGIEATPRM